MILLIGHYPSDIVPFISELFGNNFEIQSEFMNNSIDTINLYASRSDLIFLILDAHKAEHFNELKCFCEFLSG